MAVLTNLQILPHCLLCKDFKQCKRKFTPNVHRKIYMKYEIRDGERERKTFQEQKAKMKQNNCQRE